MRHHHELFTVPLAVAAALVAFLCVPSQNAYAVAAFSRQTGEACSYCHTTFPELNATGREFKLNGYTLSAGNEVTEKGEKESGLALLGILPLSINLRGAVTHTAVTQPGAENSNIELPQQVNLWFAGRLSNNIGSYTQMTYGVQSNHFQFDNSDFFRFAGHTKLGGKNLTLGIDANNNPTFEDVWNSTPAYGFPYMAPDLASSPPVGTIVDGGLGGDVVGAGGYAYWNNLLYGDVTAYRTQHIGAPQPLTGTGFAHNISGAAPYWRFAWQGSSGSNFLELGTYGLKASFFPDTISGNTNDYTDIAADLTYERKLLKDDLFTIHSTFINETQELNASEASNPKHTLRTFRLDAAYHFGNRLSLTAGPFMTTGTVDSLLYTGSANGKPDYSGYIAQVAYWPVQNLQFGVQYKGYTKFNGGGTNYDGAGTNAYDNNYTYAYMWISF